MGGRPRLCMIVHGPYPEDVRVVREAKAAVEAGFDVEVLSIQQSGEPQSDNVDGIRITRIGLPHNRGGSMLHTAFEYLVFTAAATAVLATSRRRRYDIVQVHNPPDFLMLAALVPRLLGAKTIFDVHDLSRDMFDIRFGDRRGSALIDALLALAERGALRISDRVITVHDPYQRELLRRGAARDRTHVVMNSLDERMIEGLSPNGRDGARIVYHGTITFWYGLDIVIEAVDLVRQQGVPVTLEVYGEGDAVPDLQRMVRERGLEDVVMLDGCVRPHREVLEAVSGAAAGVIPNRPSPLNQYALSSKLFEYIALGIPVVSARLPTIAEHFSDDEMIFFEPGDATSLAEALLTAVRSGSESERTTQALSRYEGYRWSTNAARYVKVLRSLVETR